MVLTIPKPSTRSILRAIYLVAAVLVLAIDGIPLKILWLLTLLNLLLEENFPFSHFPMYSSFSDFTYYIFITDENDEPIPIKLKSNFGVSTSFLKKMYDTEVRKDSNEKFSMRKQTPEDLNRAGQLTLDYVWKRAKRPAKKPYDRLRLYQENLHFECGTIRHERMLIAEVSRP